MILDDSLGLVYEIPRSVAFCLFHGLKNGIEQLLEKMINLLQGLSGIEAVGEANEVVGKGEGAVGFDDPDGVEY